MRSSSMFVASVALAAIGGASLSATTLERLTITDMADKSMIVVRGTVTGGAGELLNGVISTRYQFAVTEVWKGPAVAQMDVYVPGGRAQGFLQSVPGAPVLNTGSEYVLFLWVGPSGRPQIIGLSQGLFTVSRSKNGSVFLDRGAVSELMVDSRTGQSVTPQPVHLPMADLKSMVQKQVAASGAKVSAAR